MKLIENIEIKDLALYLVKEKTLILSDIHIGYEESLNKQGVMLPRRHLKDLLVRLEKVFENLEVSRIVINGDLKHEFGTISNTEWKETLQLLDFLLEKCKDIVLIRGNHDTILGPIAEKREIKVRNYLPIGDILICHGDKVIDKECKVVVIGHEHCAVGLREGAKREVFKCFLKGSYEDKVLIVMPSWNFVLGSDVLQERLLSPYLDDISEFEVYVVSDKTYDFGLIRDL